MPRSKTGKKRAPVNTEALQNAVEAVAKGRLSLRDAADQFGEKKSTVWRHLQLYKASQSQKYEYTSSIAVRQIFTNEEEKVLVKYLKQAAKYHYGLTRKETKSLAYEFAIQNGKNVPNKWRETKRAGAGWLRWFMRRHTSLSLRKPESTSLARSTSFHKANVSAFFDHLRTCMEKYKFQADQIYNIDETGNTNVHKPPKIIGPKGVKQLGTMTSGERGFNVTLIAAINAIGNHVPPMLIFPRVHFKPHMLNGAPPGSVGEANPSGWSNEEIFFRYLNHFIAHVKPTQERPILIVLDNHESHISIRVINLAKENHIVLLTFPPHTSHKLQPLDRTVFGPYKTFYNEAANDWLLNNPGVPITLYQISEIVGKAYPRAFSQQNIISGFRVSGIWPFNRDIFGEDEFASAFVTDRPITVEPSSTVTPSSSSEVQILATPSSASSGSSTPATHTRAKQDQTPTSEASSVISPEVIRPFPKAAPRKPNTKGRKQGRTRILTWTPEKLQIEQELESRGRKRNVKAVKRKILPESSSSEEEEPDLDESSGEASDNAEDHNEPIRKEDFLLVKIASKKSIKYFVASVVSDCTPEDDTYEVTYYKHCAALKTCAGQRFVMSDETIYEISQADIERKLPQPRKLGENKRIRSQIVFNIDFSKYNLG